MSTDQNDQAAIDAAVAAIRAQRGKGLVAISPGASPAMREAIRAAAAELGREVVEGTAPTSHASRTHRDWTARDLPEIARTDRHGFIKNISKIARGDMRVK
jgi:hypothetical protein